MTPIGFLLKHRHEILNTYTGSAVETWNKLKEVIPIADAMSENTFRALIKNFVETYQFYEGLNTQLNNEGGENVETVKLKLNIEGWTVAKSGRYYRAFKKIGGKMHGVHLGASIDGAEGKIQAKMKTISSGGQGAEKMD